MEVVSNTIHISHNACQQSLFISHGSMQREHMPAAINPEQWQRAKSTQGVAERADIILTVLLGNAAKT